MTVADPWALSDLCTPWCLHVVATLGIAGHVAAGVDEIDALATAAKCDSYVLHCVLGHPVSKGVFEEPEQGRFSLNECAHALLEPPVRLGLDLTGISGRMAYAWGSLFAYVRTGEPAYHEVFGQPFWNDLEAHPQIAAGFDALIGPPGHGPPDPEFSIAGGWEGVRMVVDVGGGTGAMLAAVLRARVRISLEHWSICRELSPVPAKYSNPQVLRTGSRLSGRVFSSRCPRAPISICCEAS